MFDSVFHGAPSSVGGQSISSGRASLGVDVNSGNLYFRTPENGGWQAVAAGSGTPSGANSDIQFNNNGAFGGSPNLTWASATSKLGISGTGLSGASAGLLIADTSGNPIAAIIPGPGFATYQGLWFGAAAAAPSGSNYTILRGNGGSTFFNCDAGQSFSINVGNTATLSIGTDGVLSGPLGNGSPILLAAAAGTPTPPNNSEMYIGLDAGQANVIIKVKTSTGSVKTATIALA